jgi:glycosyltransferase involved in cell wall biosynthesis
MRELAIKSAFSFVDHFISPSEFLRNEYIKWGLPAEKIDAIENPFPIQKSKTNREVKSPSTNQNWKLGFFGQINFYKGLDIIIDAMHKAIKKGAKVEIGVHGKMSAITGQEYIDDLENNIKKLGAHAKFYGPYQQENVQKIMSEYHFVVMGSRWYENSPVVIQEAIAAGTPLIVPSHGGMLEKGNKLSLFYTPSDSEDLERVICGLTSVAYENLINRITDYKKDAELINNFSKTLNIYLKEGN